MDIGNCQERKREKYYLQPGGTDGQLSLLMNHLARSLRFNRKMIVSWIFANSWERENESTLLSARETSYLAEVADVNKIVTTLGVNYDGPKEEENAPQKKEYVRQ